MSPTAFYLYMYKHTQKTIHVHTCVLSHFSHVSLFATLWAGAHQAPLPMGFSREEYWRGLLQGIFLTQGSNPSLLCHLHWQESSLPHGKSKVHTHTHTHTQLNYFKRLNNSTFYNIIILHLIKPYVIFLLSLFSNKPP